MAKQRHTTFLELRRLRPQLSSAGFRLRSLFPSIICAALASIFEGLALTLLIPTIHVLIESNASYLQELPLPETIRRELSELSGTGGLPVVLILIAATFTCSAAKTCFSYFAALNAAWQVKYFASELRKLVYCRYLSFGKLFFDQHNEGYLHQLLTGYVGILSGALSSVQGSIYAALTLVIYLAMMFAISWKLTFAVLFTFPILHYSLNWLIRRIEAASETFAESYNNLGKQISNALSGIPLVKAYSFEAEEREKFNQLSDEVRALEFNIERKHLLVAPLQELIMLFCLLALVSAIAFITMQNPTAKMPELAVYILTLRRAAVLFGEFSELRSAFASVTGPTREILKTIATDPRFFVAEGSREFVDFRTAVSCRDLTFTYPRGVNALEEINLTFKRGEMTAIIGETGSGKSTIVNLLLRFYDCPPGTIFVDGDDLRNFTIESWRAAIALVSQDTFLFNDSLRNNLLYGLRRNVPSEELDETIRKARLAEFVRRLPRGLETEIGDRGVTLSAGERQRVSIARAMLKRTPILILDEATSALDSVTEKLIQDALNELTKDTTTIVVAHRLSTIRTADSVYVLHRGRVVEHGSPDNLLEARGQFSRYWEEQRI